MREQLDGEGEMLGNPRGLLLVGHGTRDPEGLSEFVETVDHVSRALPGIAVEPCFLELAEPTIPAAIEKLAEKGVTRFVAMPLLLFAAGHAKRDVPDAIGKVLSSRTQMTYFQADALGLHPAIVEQSANRLVGAMDDVSDLEKQDAAVVFVGRGSLDDEATASMHSFAALVAESAGVERYEVCFYAMAKPSVAETLSQLAADNFRYVVVVPHLLFGGLILQAIRECVAEQAVRAPQTQWLIADRLGPGERLTSAIVERVQSAWQMAEKCLSATPR
jgi:sirohydrochlorin cobaltochelatase